jgi:hypothetical protein
MLSSRKIWSKNLDTMTSKIIILRDGACVQRGFDCASENHPTPRGSILTNGHVFSRRNHSVRWDIRPDGDCHTQCWACNYRHVRDQYPYFKWYIAKFGQERFDILRSEARTIKKWTISEMREYYVYMVELYKKMVEAQSQAKDSEIEYVRKLDTKVKSLYRY